MKTTLKFYYLISAFSYRHCLKLEKEDDGDTKPPITLPPPHK